MIAKAQTRVCCICGEPTKANAFRCPAHKADHDAELKRLRLQRMHDAKKAREEGNPLPPKPEWFDIPDKVLSRAEPGPERLTAVVLSCGRGVHSTASLLALDVSFVRNVSEALDWLMLNSDSPWPSEIAARCAEFSIEKPKSATEWTGGQGRGKGQKYRRTAEETKLDTPRLAISVYGRRGGVRESA